MIFPVNQKIELSVVIPTLGTRDSLLRLLASLIPERQGIAIDQFEVILSFDGPSKSNVYPPELAPFIVIVEGPHAGPATARNRGAANAKGSLIVFIDDDCVAEPWMLRTYLTSHREDGTTILEGCTRASGKRRTLAVTAPVNEQGGLLWSCNLGIPVTVFKKLGGFDERFRYPAMEDVELRERVIKAGIEIKFLPDAAVLHDFKRRGDGAYFEKHFESTLLFESIHPEQRMGPVDHWWGAIYGFCMETVPGILSYHGRGLQEASRDHFYMVVAGWRKLRYRHGSPKSPTINH